jgi:hypothetical protein
MVPAWGLEGLSAVGMVKYSAWNARVEVESICGVGRGVARRRSIAVTSLEGLSAETALQR